MRAAESGTCRGRRADSPDRPRRTIVAGTCTGRMAAVAHAAVAAAPTGDGAIQRRQQFERIAFAQHLPLRPILKWIADPVWWEGKWASPRIRVRGSEEMPTSRNHYFCTFVDTIQAPSLMSSSDCPSMGLGRTLIPPLCWSCIEKCKCDIIEFPVSSMKPSRVP